jgi:hypothetical protein
MVQVTTYTFPKTPYIKFSSDAAEPQCGAQHRPDLIRLPFTREEGPRQLPFSHLCGLASTVCTPKNDKVWPSESQKQNHESVLFPWKFKTLKQLWGQQWASLYRSGVLVKPPLHRPVPVSVRTTVINKHTGGLQCHAYNWKTLVQFVSRL